MNTLKRKKAQKRPREAATAEERAQEERRRRNRESAAQYRRRQRESLQHWRETTERTLQQVAVLREELIRERALRLQLEMAVTHLLATSNAPQPAPSPSRIHPSLWMLPMAGQPNALTPTPPMRSPGVAGVGSGARVPQPMDPTTISRPAATSDQANVVVGAGAGSNKWGSLGAAFESDLNDLLSTVST